MEAPDRKRIVWMGQTLKEIGSMPASVKLAFGRHCGTRSTAFPSRGLGPFTSVGPGVYYVREDDDGNTYRGFYAVRFARAVYVLGVFQKKSVKGIATPQKDVERIKARLAAAKEHYDANHHGPKTR